MSTPPFTNAWDETKPADSDLANTLGSQGRQGKLDIRQRLDWQHVWNQNVNDDGGHRNIVIASAYMTANQEALKASGFSLTSANAQSLVDLAGTWNTSGVPTGIKLNITDTASDASSLLLDLQVGGVSKFKVKKDGTILQNGVALVGGAYTTGFGTSTTLASAASSTTLGPTQAATDLFVYGTVDVGNSNAGSQSTLVGRADSASTPTTLVAQLVLGVTGIEQSGSFCFPVKKGDYYKVTFTGGTAGTFWCYTKPVS